MGTPDSTLPLAPTPPVDQPAAPAPVDQPTPAGAAPVDQPAAAAPPPVDQDDVDIEALAATIRADVELELRGELAQRMADQQGQPATAAAPATLDLSGQTQPERAAAFADWPTDPPGDLPQPWDHRALNIHRDPELAAGAPNTIAPIVIDHGMPILASGSADPSVQILGKALGVLGFENSVSKGTNPFGAVDQTIMGAVAAFRSVFGVLEDPTGFGGNTPAGAQLAAAHIGPWTWEGILRAAAHKLELAAA